MHPISIYLNLHPIAIHKESNCNHKEFSFVIQYVASPATRMLDSYTAAIYSKSRSAKTRKGGVLRHDGQSHIVYFLNIINTVHWTVDFWFSNYIANMFQFFYIFFTISFLQFFAIFFTIIFTILLQFFTIIKQFFNNSLTIL